MTLEACVGNLNEAFFAKKLGAHQIELCDRLDLDGTNPPIEVVKKVCNEVNIQIKVIINPNPFNYVYNSEDIQYILKYIHQLNDLPIHGIVFGPLSKEGLPDLNTIKIIADNTHLPITYHKAIDTTENILESTSLLAEQDIIKFILTSGGKNTAIEGHKNLLEMKTLLYDSPIQLIGAGKITNKNLSQLNDLVNLDFYHGKKIVGELNSNN